MNNTVSFGLVVLAFSAGIASDNWATRYKRAAHAVGVNPAFQADASKSCPEVDQRKFFQQKDGLWVEQRDAPGALDWRMGSIGIDALGGVHLETSRLFPNDMQRAATQLLRESTAWKAEK